MQESAIWNPQAPLTSYALVKALGEVTIELGACRVKRRCMTMCRTGIAVVP